MLEMVRDETEIGSVLTPLGVELDDLKSLVDHSRKDTVALLTGSVRDGFANSRSDVDLIVILPSLEEADVRSLDVTERQVREIHRIGDTALIHYALPNGTRLQITATSEQNIRFLQDQALAHLERVDRRIKTGKMQSSGANSNLQLVQLEILHRFTSGLVVHNSGKAEALRSRLPKARLAEYLVIERNQRLGRILEDLFGIEDAYGPGEELETKLYIYERALITAASVVLHSVGETQVSEKFIFRLMRRHAGRIGQDAVNSILSCYFDLPTRIVQDQRGVLRVLDDCIETAGLLTPVLAQFLQAMGRKPISAGQEWVR